MSRLEAIRARLEGRSSGAHVAYESEFGCGGYLLKEPGDEEFFAWAGDDVLALLDVAEAAVELCRGSMVPERWIENKIALEKAVAALEEGDRWTC